MLVQRGLTVDVRRMCIDAPGACRAERRRRAGRQGIHGCSALTRRFRDYCLELGLPACGRHAFRRGAANDKVRAGMLLGTVLHAGDWRSGAFLRYISRESLDTHAALNAMLSLSDSE